MKVIEHSSKPRPSASPLPLHRIFQPSIQLARVGVADQYSGFGDEEGTEARQCARDRYLLLDASSLQFKDANHRQHAGIVDISAPHLPSIAFAVFFGLSAPLLVKSATTKSSARSALRILRPQQGLGTFRASCISLPSRRYRKNLHRTRNR